MNPILFKQLEHQGKALLYNNIMPGMKGDAILQILTCALEELYGKLDLSCVNMTAIGVTLSTCKDDAEAQLTFCNLFNSIVTALAATNAALTTVQSQIATVATAVQSFTDELVKVNAADPTPGYLATKVTTDQPGTISTNPANSAIVLHGFIPIGGCMFYKCTDFSKFDVSGKGKINTDVWGFAICNGNNGTDNTNGLYIKSSTNLVDQGATSGNDSVSIVKANLPNDNYSASISGTTSTDGLHSHSYMYRPDAWGSANNNEAKDVKNTTSNPNTSTDGEHSHTFNGSASFKLNDGEKLPININPKHISRIEIQRIF